MIYIIDHHDSFTQNVVHQFQNFDEVVCTNFNKINQNKLKKADIIVFSPGPGAPKDYPISSEIYKKFKGKKKIIGICLGFQQILHCENGIFVCICIGILLMEENWIFLSEKLFVLAGTTRLMQES